MHSSLQLYRFVAVVVLLAVATGAHAVAQPKAIKIRQGESIEFHVRAAIEVTELVGDAESSLRAETGGIAMLRARRVSRRKIEWTYETPDVKLTRVTSTAEPGESDETTVKTKTGKISTDVRGKLVKVTTPKTSKSLASLMEAMHSSLVKLWFQPQIFHKKRPGDSWSENRDEQIGVDELGINVRTRYEVTYRFDGIVDTLGVKAIRLSWTAGHMTIEGTRTVDGKTSPVVGDGEHTGTSYFSTIDGLMLASQSENSVDLRVSSTDEGGRVIPMMWRMRSESIRR